MRFEGILAAIGLTTTLASCGGDADAPGAEPRPHVVMFLVDTLRADYLGCYGAEEPTSPNIDAIAAEGVVFEQANAPAPWTVPSVASADT